MKYIKRYENSIHPTTKKFSIIKYMNSPDSALFVVEFKHYMNNDSAIIILYYRYLKTENKIVKEDEKPFTLNDLNIYDTVMSSDNLQDCLDYVEKIRDMNKYNL